MEMTKMNGRMPEPDELERMGKILLFKMLLSAHKSHLGYVVTLEEKTRQLHYIVIKLLDRNIYFF